MLNKYLPGLFVQKQQKNSKANKSGESALLLWDNMLKICLYNYGVCGNYDETDS